MTFWRDKVVVVTGGSAGLGFVLSQAYATAGSQVVIASRNENQGVPLRLTTLLGDFT